MKLELFLFAIRTKLYFIENIITLLWLYERGLLQESLLNNYDYVKIQKFLEIVINWRTFLTTHKMQDESCQPPHIISSEKSPQSLSPSQTEYFEIHAPFAHLKKSESQAKKDFWHNRESYFHLQEIWKNI